jgi:hypothetical protein
MTRKIILFELNEVPFRVFDDYCATRPNSALAKVAKLSLQYETITEDINDLSPWITWPSLHRGVNDEKHGIKHLGQDVQDINQTYPPIWVLLQQAGFNVGVGGSLYSYPLPDNYREYSFYLPDTFASSPEAFPRALEVFQDFNLYMVSKSARVVDKGLPLAKAMTVLTHLPSIGIRSKSLLSIVQQLVNEKIDAARKVRRRTYQSVLAFDAFLKQLKINKPEFCTFFTNHAASAMHRYWAASYPDDYDQLTYSPEWISKFSNEIFFAMDQADLFVEDLLNFVNINREYVLVIATSMGQKSLQGYPYHSLVSIEDLDKFMNTLGVPLGAWEAKPVMSPEYSIIVDSQYEGIFKQNLENLCLIDPNSPLNWDYMGNGFFHWVLNYPNLPSEKEKIFLQGKPMGFADLGLKVISSDFQEGAAADHIPEGMLIIYDPQKKSETMTQPTEHKKRPQVSTLEIVPAILRNFNQSIPSYMQQNSSLVLTSAIDTPG